jgi:hypothetical protein
MLVRQLHDEPGARDSTPVHALGVDADLTERKVRHEAPEPHEREPEIQQPAEDHVPADPGEGIENETLQRDLSQKNGFKIGAGFDTVKAVVPGAAANRAVSA